MLILHHYPMSPFSEKVRLMLGYADVPWQSLHSPEMPPRPNIDPLSGGYRRIPIAQIGADIFCDSRVISNEIAVLGSNQALNPALIKGENASYAAQLEGEVFWGAVLSIPKGVTIRKLLRELGLWKTLRFLKDRAGMGRGARMAVPSAAQAAQVFAEHLAAMELRLQANFLCGEAPQYVEFAAYHTLWFKLFVGQLPMPAGLPKVAAWYQHMQAIGHGECQQISREAAFAAAREGVPRQVRAAHTRDPLIGTAVTVQPTDYGLEGVDGTLVGSSPFRWIVRRETDDFGILHVHFPKAGFELHSRAG